VLQQLTCSGPGSRVANKHSVQKAFEHGGGLKTKRAINESQQQGYPKKKTTFLMHKANGRLPRVDIAGQSPESQQKRNSSVQPSLNTLRDFKANNI